MSVISLIPNFAFRALSGFFDTGRLAAERLADILALTGLVALVRI
jgi:hypothetical protein